MTGPRADLVMQKGYFVMPMLELDELRLRLTAMEPALRELRQALDIDRLEVEIGRAHV